VNGPTPLPMAPPASCALDNAQLDVQLARYRRAGERARVVQDSPQELVIAVSEVVDDRMVEELVAIERSCCPFFTIDWAASERTLKIRVSTAQDVPALDAVRRALVTA
jgi:hypothetical protein